MVAQEICLAKEMLSEVVFSLQKHGGGGLQGLLVFTRGNFSLKLEFLSRALSKIDIQSVKLCKMMYVSCCGIQTDLDSTSVSCLCFSVVIFCFVLLLSILAHFSLSHSFLPSEVIASTEIQCSLT